MNWKTIRLELAGTREFPTGSVSRAFLLRLPLHEDGSIDESEFVNNPSRATVRRFWPSEPDRSGAIVRANGALAFRYGSDDLRTCLFPSQRIRLGEEVVVKSSDGRELPFRVAGVKQFG